MEILYKKSQEITPYENNPRTHSQEQVNQIVASIKEYGFTNPILIDENNIIIAGHGRLLAALQLNIAEVPCIVLKGLTETQKKAYVIADNKMALNAGWDEELLKLEMENLKEVNFNLELTGFDLGEIDEILNFGEEETEIIEVEVPEVPKEAKTKPGEIYQLGNHRLMCGDSTNRENIEKLMDGKLADLMVTDPPYNVNVSNSEGMKIENDNMSESAFRELLHKAFECASSVLKEGGAFYIWHADTESVTFRTECENNNLMVKQCLIWVKNGFNFGRQDYKWQHEPCLYGWKEGSGHYFVNEYNHSTVIEDEIDIDKMKKAELKEMLKEILDSKIPTTVIHENKPIKNDLHPTMKPIRLCADMIRNSSRKEEKIIDIFGGSGSTMIACEQLNRRCYMMELDPKYADVIIERWENFTGKKAVKIG